MKAAIIGDIHANLLALQLALEDAQKEKCDQYIFLGDYITDSEYSNEVLNLVKKHATYAIIGNREKYMLNYDVKRKEYNNYKPISYTYETLTKDNIDYIKSLKQYIITTIGTTKVLIIHGDTDWANKNEIFRFYDKIIEKFNFDLCLYGHSHMYNDISYKGKRFINPGSMGAPTDTPTYKYCILEPHPTIKVQLREFKVSDTYETLEQNYKNTTYYKENPIWGNLILKMIKDSNDHPLEFLKLLNTKSDNINDLTPFEFNRVWEETYQEYCQNGKEKTNA